MAIDSSYLILYGKDFSWTPYKNSFLLAAINENNEPYELVGHGTGSLLWRNRDLGGAAITSIYNQGGGRKGYIAFASGLILQWVETHNYNNPGTYQSFVYQLSFTSCPCVLLVNIGFISSERSLLYVSDQQTDKNQVVISGPKQSYFQYFAIGY